MPGKFFYALIFAGLILMIFPACKKVETGMDETALYGTWIKGSYTGDTLRFFRNNEKNILSYNLSFNELFFAPREHEYNFRDGKLGLKNYLATPGNFFMIQSFQWEKPGLEFKIQGSELFPFMASTGVYFTYRKIP